MMVLLTIEGLDWLSITVNNLFVTEDLVKRASFFVCKVLACFVDVT